MYRTIEKNSADKNAAPVVRPGPSGEDVLKIHAVARILLNGLINNIQVSWVKEGPRMSQLLLDSGANDLGGTLMNESISTAAGAQYGQLMKPKYLRSVIKEIGRTPVERTTLYRVVKEFDQEEPDSGSALDEINPSQFGSYHELIKLDQFRYRTQR